MRAGVEREAGANGNRAGASRTDGRRSLSDRRIAAVVLMLRAQARLLPLSRQCGSILVPSNALGDGRVRPDNKTGGMTDPPCNMRTP
jgi:hypothetical protein